MRRKPTFALELIVAGLASFITLCAVHMIVWVGLGVAVYKGRHLLVRAAKWAINRLSAGREFNDRYNAWKREPMTVAESRLVVSRGWSQYLDEIEEKSHDKW